MLYLTDDSNRDALRALEQREAREHRRQPGQWARAVASIESQLRTEKAAGRQPQVLPTPPPRAGARGYEPQSAAPDERWRGWLAYVVIGAGCVVAMYGALIVIPIVGDLIRRVFPA